MKVEEDVLPGAEEWVTDKVPLRFREQTMQKVWDSLKEAGFSDQAVLDGVAAMQNAGIYFREAPDG